MFPSLSASPLPQEQTKGAEKLRKQYRKTAKEANPARSSAPLTLSKVWRADREFRPEEQWSFAGDNDWTEFLENSNDQKSIAECREPLLWAVNDFRVYKGICCRMYLSYVRTLIRMHVRGHVEVVINPGLYRVSSSFIQIR